MLNFKGMRFPIDVILVRILVITATDSCPNVATNFYVKAAGQS